MADTVMREHEWVSFQSGVRPLTVCKVCCIVQRAAGENKPCKGPGQMREMEKTWPLKQDKAHG